MTERDYCIFYAKNCSTDELKKYQKMFLLKFEIAKYNKHATQGKTTRHRKTKKEQNLGKLRNAVKLCSRIFYYKKMLSQNKIILDCEIEIRKPLYDFLIGG